MLRTISFEHRIDIASGTFLSHLLNVQEAVEMKTSDCIDQIHFHMECFIACCESDDRFKEVQTLIEPALKMHLIMIREYLNRLSMLSPNLSQQLHGMLSSNLSGRAANIPQNVIVMLGNQAAHEIIVEDISLDKGALLTMGYCFSDLTEDVGLIHEQEMQNEKRLGRSLPSVAVLQRQMLLGNSAAAHSQSLSASASPFIPPEFIAPRI